MTERSRRILYRLYGLAEVAYWNSWNRNWKEAEKLSIVVKEEPEDDDGDEWTMYENDYNLIREVMQVYDDNTDWVTIDLPEYNEENPLFTIEVVEDEN